MFRALLICALLGLAGPAAAAPWGRLVSADGKTAHALEKPAVVIGSARPADVVIADPTVSQRHCRITYDRGSVAIEDLGSRYGTLLAGTALKKGKPMPILQKTEVALGAATWFFEFGERPAVIQPLHPAAPKKPLAPLPTPRPGAAAPPAASPAPAVARPKTVEDAQRARQPAAAATPARPTNAAPPAAAAPQKPQAKAPAAARPSAKPAAPAPQARP